MKKYLKKCFFAWRFVRRAQFYYLVTLTSRRIRKSDFPDKKFRLLLQRIHRSSVKGELLCEDSAVRQIEAHRAQFLRSREFLNDGSQGSDSFSEGVTVRDAVEVSKFPELASVLYLLIQWQKPETVIEFGTNFGMSAAWQAAALKANGGGVIHTFEGSPYRMRFAQNWVHSLGLNNIYFHNQKFDEAIDAGLTAVKEVDSAFIDGNHRHEATLNYFKFLGARASKGAIFVFDDVLWSGGMKAAWREIQEYEDVYCSFEYAGMGRGFFLMRKYFPVLAKRYLRSTYE